MDKVEIFSDDTALKRRFRFGKNWAQLIDQIDSRRLDAAIRDMGRFVGRLEGKDFLDIGCGSGLSSLAAHHLGAASITSIVSDADVSQLPRADLVCSWCSSPHRGDVESCGKCSKVC